MQHDIITLITVLHHKNDQNILKHKEHKFFFMVVFVVNDVGKESHQL